MKLRNSLFMFSVTIIEIPEEEDDTESGVGLVTGWSIIEFDNGTTHVPDQLQAINSDYYTTCRLF